MLLPRHAALLLLILLLVAACATPGRQVVRRNELPEAAVRAYLDGLRLLESGDPAGALAAIGPALDVEPWHVPSHQVHQDALRATGQVDAARAWYGEALAAAPADWSRRLLHARLLDDVAAQRTAYEGVLEAAPESPWPRIALGYHLARAARKGRAEAAELSQRGRLADAAATRTGAEERQARAEKMARSVVDENPSLSVAHGLLADVLLEDPRAEGRVERLSRAAAAARRAATLDPASPGAHDRLAHCLRLRSDDEGAASSLRRAIELGGPRALLLARLGRVLLDLQEPGDARRALEQSLAADDRPESAWINLGVAHYRLEEWDGAEAAFREASERAPADPLPWEGVALSRARRGDREGAKSAMRRYLELGGQDRERGAEFIDRMELPRE